MNLTVYEKWWSDPRRAQLIKRVGEYSADGLAISIWRLSQRFLEEGVPLHLFNAFEDADHFLMSGLAERCGDFVYIRGTGHLLLMKRTRQQNGGKRRPLKSLRKKIVHTSTHSVDTSGHSVCTERLEAIYEGYPRKIGKKEGMRRLIREALSVEDLDQLEKAVKNYTEHCRDRDPRYVKHFSSFVSSWKEWITPPREMNSMDDWMEKKIKEMKGELIG